MPECPYAWEYVALCHHEDKSASRDRMSHAQRALSFVARVVRHRHAETRVTKSRHDTGDAQQSQ